MVSSNTKGFADALELRQHFADHAVDFGAVTESEYQGRADFFLTKPFAPTMFECFRSKGDFVRFDNSTHEYGVLSGTGIIRTYYHPKAVFHATASRTTHKMSSETDESGVRQIHMHASLTAAKTHPCPVCGYGLSKPAADFIICPSCGVEFGYSDVGATYSELRDEWMAFGPQWSSIVVPMPYGWNPWSQMYAAGIFPAVGWLMSLKMAVTTQIIAIGKASGPGHTTASVWIYGGCSMKNHAFIICDRVLTDADYGPSVISAFQQITVSVIPDNPVPEDAVVPRDWAIFTSWFMTDDEVGKDYIQKTKFFWPDGKQYGEQALMVSARPGRDYVTFVTRVVGFPVGISGRVRVNVELFCEDESVWGPEDAYISCVHVPDGMTLEEALTMRGEHGKHGKTADISLTA